MPYSAMTLEATGLPAAGPEEARRLLARGAGRLRGPLGDDHAIALPQLAADDFRGRAVVEPDADGHRRGLAVAQHHTRPGRPPTSAPPADRAARAAPAPRPGRAPSGRNRSACSGTISTSSRSALMMRVVAVMPGL